MSCIHFKFKSSLDYEKLTFDGLHISLSDLKEAIMKQKKIGSVNQYTLSVKDAQSKKEYTDDQEMIPRNTSVIISRVPLANPVKIPKTQRKDHTLSQPESVSTTVTSAPSSLPPLTSHRQLTASELQETADLASANASEEDKVKAMMNQSSKDYDPSRYVSVPPSRGGGVAGMKRHPPPPTYICHRCGKKGHWIQLCPTNGDPSFDNRNYKRSLGTPASQIISTTANLPGVMLDRHGNPVMRKVDYQAYVDAQRKVKPEAPAKLDVPDELVCPICKKLVKDAVIIQCCSESFCYECIQEYLCENEFTCPLCKATDVSPETLVPNKALRTAAKNFQLKESEHKSVSEARGYIPMVTPQQVVLSSKNLPPISAGSAPSASSSSSSVATSGISNGPTGGVANVSSKATPNKDKDAATTKSGETEPEEVGGTADLLTVKAEEEETLSQEKSSSPTPQLPRLKNRSEALLDRILSKKQTPPPTTLPTSSTMVSTSSNLPAVAPPTTAVAPPTAASLLGSVGVASGLAPPTIAATAAAKALLSGAATVAGVPVASGSLLGMPRGPAASCTLPGQGAVLTTSAILPPPPPVVITEPNQSQEESAKLERIAAELMLAAAATTKKSASPPPLTAEEFYRQQKMLRLFAKQSRKRTPSPYSGASDFSRSSTPDSFRSASDSSSLSRSDSPSGSSYSSSQSRSRSRSPIASQHSHRSKKHRSRHHKHEKARREKSREKGKERKSGHHRRSRKKRKRRLSPESEERLSKDRKKLRDNPALSALAEDDLLSPGSSLPSGALSPEMELESQGSHRKHRHHKKRSKAKHSRRRIRSDEEMDMDLLARDFPTDYLGEHNLEEVDQDTLTENVKETILQDADSAEKMELADNEGAREESKEDKVTSEVDGVPAAETSATDGTCKKNSARLVPYQDSSTTETEGREQDEPTGAAASSSIQDRPAASSQGSKEQRPSSTSSSGSVVGDKEINEAIEELEAVLKEVTAATDVKSDGDKATTKERAAANVKSVGGDEAVDEGVSPTAAKEEEEQGEEAAEDSLMIAVHVDEDAIDQDSAELLDAECPNKGKEDGEITDSDKNDSDDDDKRDTGPLSSSSTDKAPPSAPHSSSSSQAIPSPTKIISLKSPTSVSSVATVLKRTNVLPVPTKDVGEELGSGRGNDSNVDLRVILNEQKKKQQQQVVKKHFASAVTKTSGYMMSSSQPYFESSTPVDEEWSSDEEMDSPSGSESSSEMEKLRSLKASDSKHSSSLTRHKRKHSSSKSRREKEKKRKRAKEYSESKKKSRREEREREKAKKRKKHKKSEKYSTKYSH